MSSYCVGVVGLGKLGLPLAATYAGSPDVYEVQAWDINEAARTELKGYTGSEPTVADLLRQFHYKIELVETEFMLDACDVVFVVVPTPSLDSGSLDARYVSDAIEQLLEGLATRPKDDLPMPTIVVVSTVSPGTFDYKLVPLVESHDVHLAYAPTFIALGNVVHDLRFPTQQLIGADDDVAADMANGFVRLVARDTIYLRSAFRNVEVAKLATNSYLTQKISFANSVAHVCDAVEADVAHVLTMVGADPRVGPQYLNAGPGFGGPCLPRDNRALYEPIHRRLYTSRLGDAVDGFNVMHARYLVDRAVHFAADADPSTYHVLGTSYKEGVPYEIESFGSLLIRELEDYHLGYAELSEADVVICALALRDLDLRGKIKKGATFLDLWRTHRYLADPVHEVTYVPLGG